MSGLTAKRSNRLLLVVGLTALAVCLTACRPHGILSSRQMRKIMIDIHKTDALLQVHGLHRGHDDAENHYYAAVLEKHGVTQAEFDSSLVWYTNHPKLFDKIYPHVLQDLAAEKAAFEALHAAELEAAGDTQKPTATPTLSKEEAALQIDSLCWTMRHGAPAYGWIPGWHREKPQPVQIPYESSNHTK